MRKWMMLILAATLLLSGCGAPERTTVRIAEQYGLAYAPLTVAKELNLIEPYLPEGYTVAWSQLMNTAAIREAMLADELDIGFMGIPPFLIGYDKQMEWTIFRGLSRAPVGLAVRTDRATSLDEIAATGRIALPQPGSIQHILLTMYLERETGSVAAMDTSLVTLSHPDGQVALLSETDVVAHFTSPPYLFEELADPRVDLLVDGEAAFGGPFTFIVGVVSGAFTDQDALDAVNRGIDDAVKLIEEDPERAGEILAGVYGMDPETVIAYLQEDGMDFGSDVLGIQRFIDFMRDNGYLETDFSEGDVRNEP